MKHLISFVDTAVAVQLRLRLHLLLRPQSGSRLTLAHSLLTCTGTLLPGSLTVVALSLDFTLLNYLSLRLLNT